MCSVALRAYQYSIQLGTNGETISATPSHPFYVNKFGWTLAGSLRAGDVLVLSNGELVTVEWVQHEILESPIKVYNFEVEDYHTYFVCECEVLVHNVCGNEPYLNERGEYTDGTYTMSTKGNSDHTQNMNTMRKDDTLPPSRFMYQVDDIQATFDAARYADSNNLWKNNKATVYVENGYVGVTGSGIPTSYICVSRTESGYIHAWPANPPE